MMVLSEPMQQEGAEGWDVGTGTQGGPQEVTLELGLQV